MLTASDGADPHKLLPNLAEKLPFRVRLLNMQNMHVAPLNEESIDSQARNALAASSPTVTANKILSRLPPGGKGKELFLQYKTWEGTLYPFQDERRPMANVFHNKLVVSIDWEYLVVSEDDLLARAPSSPVPSLLPSPTSLSSLAQRTEDVLKKHSSQQMQFPVNDDGEYIMPLHLLHSECDIPKEISPVMQFIDHASFVDYQIKTMKNQRLLTSSSTASTTTGSVGKSQDQRIGLTIEQVLQDYMASEVIPDYHCDNCSTTKPSNGAMLANKGTLYTSISALPDTLILHLKRLVINATGGSKIRTLVKFPIQGLDMSTFTLEHFSRQRYRDDMITEGYLDDLPDMQAILKLLAAHDTNVVYDLFGVVNHMGGMFGGHYTAYVLCEDISYATTTGSIAGGPAELRMREYLTQVGISNQPLPTPTLNGPGLNAAQLSTTIPFLQPPAVSENGHDGNKRWYKFDDEFVHDLQYPTSYTGYPANLGQSSTGMPAANVEQTIVSESAYILFYQRRNLSVTHMLPFL